MYSIIMEEQYETHNLVRRRVLYAYYGKETFWQKLIKKRIIPLYTNMETGEYIKLVTDICCVKDTSFAF